MTIKNIILFFYGMKKKFNNINNNKANLFSLARFISLSLSLSLYLCINIYNRYIYSYTQTYIYIYYNTQMKRNEIPILNVYNNNNNINYNIISFFSFLEQFFFCCYICCSFCYQNYNFYKTKLLFSLFVLFWEFCFIFVLSLDTSMD